MRASRCRPVHIPPLLSPPPPTAGIVFLLSHDSPPSSPKPSTSSAMPARTLSPLVAADRASLSPPQHRAFSPSYPRRDNGQPRTSEFYGHIPDYYFPFDAPGHHPHAPTVHMHVSHNPLTSFNASYAHTSLPMQRTHAQWQFPYPLSTLPSAATGWLPRPPTTGVPSPPQILHKVWIVDCQSCGMFLTNRGMKAVLLLRPHVPLYSTDAMPINCSTQPMTVASSPTSARLATSASASSTSAMDQVEHISPPPSAGRTCECLTQTLWCHGCGTSVGYMIVVPCVRCTSSMTVTNRSTNGHRFVFYSKEIVATQRHYVAEEIGIVSPAFSPRLVLSPTHPSPSTASPPSEEAHRSSPTLSPARAPTTPTRRRHSNASLLDSPSQWQSHRIRDPPASPSSFSVLSSPPPLDPITPQIASRTRSASHPNIGSLELEPLKAGDVLYWHHLARHGEIPGVADDPRARNPQLSSEGDTPATNQVSSLKPSPIINVETSRRKITPMAGR
ncbi:hypothetical protein BC835DRAFT_1418116 [Cytidiella melzeri]|nr:hypothetical protein BC835DRAFT_1418116 [Cytidiella melzeri]